MSVILVAAVAVNAVTRIRTIIQVFMLLFVCSKIEQNGMLQKEKLTEMQKASDEVYKKLAKVQFQ